MARCSSVSFRPVSYTSMASRMKGLVFTVSNAYGGSGRNWLDESITKGRILNQFGSTPSMYAGGVGTHRPGAFVTVNFAPPRVCRYPSVPAHARMCFATVSPYATDRANTSCVIPGRRRNRSSMSVRMESIRARENVRARATARYACTPASPLEISPGGGAGTSFRPRSWPANERYVRSFARIASYAAMLEYEYARLACGGLKMS